MKFISLVIAALSLGQAVLCANSEVHGIYDLVARQLPQFADKFEFALVAPASTSSNDSYTISTKAGQDIVVISGTTVNSLARGFYYYVEQCGRVSISWTASTINTLGSLPKPCGAGHGGSINGAAIVPWRYYFNTVTFGYTTAFYSWADWEHLLDWAAMHGINMPLAWVGYEQVLIDVFEEFGFSQAQIVDFLSGPAFQPWNRFGNIQGSWNGSLPLEWPRRQMQLQQKIVKRMVELGMTPILPSFTGFVPPGITELYPDSAVINSSSWAGFPVTYTNVTFLEPLDPLFTKLQVAVIQRQQTYYGNVTHYYTLDQYNENSPFSGDVGYLKNVSSGTIESLRAADPNAVWVMQGWLFFSDASFWTDERIRAYLSGPDIGQLLILDLFSEGSPQWQRTNSYYGHDWIWCELHGFGGNQGLEGNLPTLTQGFTSAMANSSSLVGVGLTMEGQEGNQIVYDILLDQAWSTSSLNIRLYTKEFVKARYGPMTVPADIIECWYDLVSLVYMNNASSVVNVVPKSIYELAPNINGLLNITGHHPTKAFYDFSSLVTIWKKLVGAVAASPTMLQHPHVHYDLVDITRQVLANQFLDLYVEFMDFYNTTNPSASTFSEVIDRGQPLLDVLRTADSVLYTDVNFLLGSWIARARALADGNDTIADYYEFEARNQITLWGPTGQINNYASKQWGGLVGSYYLPQWQMFVETLAAQRNVSAFQPATFLHTVLLPFGAQWQWEKWGQSENQTWGVQWDLLPIVLELVKKF
ncbi:tim-barrel domain-containing protein [Lipomyces orientalis]|uniref:Tim-barrel domain-containing protein n=1 Tax=Lipomyces orientalis TaxID=1233043 RepID=A0ACC3TH90_9ASCO